MLPRTGVGTLPSSSEPRPATVGPAAGAEYLKRTTGAKMDCLPQNGSAKSHSGVCQHRHSSQARKPWYRYTAKHKATTR